MNRNQLILLVVVLVILGGAGLVLVKHNQESWAAPEGKAGQKLFPKYQVNDVATIHIEGDGSDLHLVHKDDGWKVKERDDYPANFTQISELLIKMGDLKVAQSDGIGAAQLGRMHLEVPGKGADSATLLELKDNSGKDLETLLIGKKHVHDTGNSAPSPMGEDGFADGRYVMLPSDPKTLLLLSDALNSVDPKAAQWLNKDFFKIEKPREIDFVSTNATNSWKAVRAVDNGPWLLAGIPPEENVDSNKLTSLGGAMSYPSFVDVATNTSAEKTGMDHPLQVTIETFDHFKYAMKIGAKSPENDYYFTVDVSADLPAQREAGKDEKPDEKKKLDKDFADKLKASQDRLKQEQSLGKYTYLVNTWLVDPLIRPRSEFIVPKKAPETKENGATNSGPEETPSPSPVEEPLSK
jgi:hypothetical protein